MHCSKRILNIFKHCDQIPDVIIIKNGSEGFVDKNFFYTTGLHQGLFEGCAAVLIPDGSVHLFVTKLEADLAIKSQAIIHEFKTKKELSEQLKIFLKNIESIGINTSGLMHSDYLFLSNTFPKNPFSDVTSAMNKSRMIKDETEITSIKQACVIADRVAEEIPQFIKEGMTENELAAEIDYHLQKYGSSHPAFNTIASFGKHTALPHYTHGDKTLQKGDFILCDFGATVHNYNSDITRTFVYETASDKQEHIYQTVLKAQEKALSMIQPEKIANMIHQSVEEYINSTDYQDRFIHSTGHSLGLSVHDPGIGLNSTSTEPLKKNMILTVEPGIYISEFGGVRIEDDILITENGCDVLTKSSKEFTII